MIGLLGHMTFLGGRTLLPHGLAPILLFKYNFVFINERDTAVRQLGLLFKGGANRRLFRVVTLG
jgi:hypothetical protein